MIIKCPKCDGSQPTEHDKPVYWCCGEVVGHYDYGNYTPPEWKYEIK